MNDKAGYTSTFHIRLKPECTHPANNQIDRDAMHDQVVELVGQQWILHSNHEFHANSRSGLYTTLDNNRNEQANPPSNNLWTKYCRLFLPAANNFEDEALGVLHGVSPDIFGNNKRCTDYILRSIYDQYLESMGENPYTFCEFQALFGIRRATYQPINAPTHKNEHIQPSPKANAYFMTCVDRKRGVKICDNLLRGASQHADSLRSSNDNEQPTWTLELNGAKFAIIPFPDVAKDKHELLQKLINVNKRIKSNEFKIISTQRIPPSTSNIVIKQMLLHPDIFLIAPVFVIDDPTPVGHRILLRVTPETAIIVATTLHLLPGLTPGILLPNLRNFNHLTSTPIWSTIVRDSTSTPDIYRQTISAVDNQWNTSTPQQLKNQDTKTPPPERKRPRFNTNSGRGGTPSRGRGRGYNTATPNQNPLNHHPRQDQQVHWYDEHNWYDIKYSESLDEAHHKNMEELHHLETIVERDKNKPTKDQVMVDNEPNTKDLKNLRMTTDTEGDVVEDYDQLKMSAADKAFLENLPLSQRRWEGPTDTLKEHKTIYKRLFHHVVHFHSHRLQEYENMQIKCAYSATPDPTSLEETIHKWTS